MSGGKAATAGPYDRKRSRSGLNFNFFLLSVTVMTVACVFVVYLHTNATRSDLRSQHLQEKMSEQRGLQKELRMKLARLKSPGRIARIAIDKYDMTEPCGVIYLKYSRDGSGKLSCQSTVERRVAVPSMVREASSPGEEEGAGEDAISQR